MSTIDLTTIPAKPAGYWREREHLLDESARPRVVRWLTDGVDDLPASDAPDPVDAMSVLADSMWFMPGTGVSRDTQDWKDLMSWLIGTKRWLLATYPPIGTVVTVLSDGHVSHGYPIGSKLRVIAPPFVPDSTLLWVGGERRRLADIRVVNLSSPAESACYVTAADLDDWRVPQVPPLPPESSTLSTDEQQRLVDVFSEVYMEAAERRGWCSEAEEVTRLANAALARAGFTATLSERTRTVEGYIDVPITVYVRMPFQVEVSRAAEGEDVQKAIINAFQADNRSSEDVVREALAASPATSRDYDRLAYVAVEWNAPDVEDLDWDYRFA